VTASVDKTARIWDAATGTPIARPLRHEGVVRSATFSPDGKRVLTASDDWSAQLWDATTGDPIGQPFRHQAGVSAAFNLDGKWIVTASSDKTAQVWDAATHTPIGRPMQHEGPLYGASFSPDGARVLTRSNDAPSLRAFHRAGVGCIDRSSDRAALAAPRFH
jgi:WD40 repeat protein